MQIRELAALQFTVDEVATITGITPSKLTTGKNAQEFLAGRLEAQALVRQAIFEAAKQGSTPAQKEFMTLVDRSSADFSED